MVRVHFPENRENSLVAENHLPGRLKESRAGCEEMLGKLFCEEPLPG